MSPKEFVNYINGAVELGNLKEVDEKNYVTLTAKLATVSPDSSKESVFCTWLQGVVDMVDEPKLNTTQFSKVINKMQQIQNSVQTTPVIPQQFNADNKMRC